MQPPNFEDTKLKQDIAVNPLPRIIFISENYKLHRIKDLYKSLHKIYMISIRYDAIKSYYARSAMREKKG